MKIPILLTLCPLLMPASALAGTVLYTDAHHPPQSTSMRRYPLFILTARSSCRRRLSCSHRSGKPVNRNWPQSVRWCVPRSRVSKVPAVVFYDKEVVYGTADVARAVALRA